MKELVAGGKFYSTHAGASANRGKLEDTNQLCRAAYPWQWRRGKSGIAATMQLARVIGTVVATVKNDSLEGRKLLVVQT